jgi:hypothetical protein
VALPNAGVTEQQDVLVLLNKSPTGKFEDQRTINSVKLPIESIERFVVAKAGGLDATFDKAISSSLQLVVNEQSDEVDGAEVLGSGLLRSQRKHIGHPA